MRKGGIEVKLHLLLISAVVRFGL